MIWSFPRDGKETVINCRVSSLGICLSNCPVPNSECWKLFFYKGVVLFPHWEPRDTRSTFENSILQQTRVYPYPLGAGSARPNPKMGAPDPENPLFLGFSVLRGGSRPWFQTMVSEGARPWGRGRSGDGESFYIL